MLNKPSIIEYNHYKFFIFCAPDETSLEYYREVSYFS